MEGVVPRAASGSAVENLDRTATAANRVEAVLEPVEAELEPAVQDARAPLRQQPQPVVVGGSAPELEAWPLENETSQLEQRARLLVDRRRSHAAPPRRRAP